MIARYWEEAGLACKDKDGETRRLINTDGRLGQMMLRVGDLGGNSTSLYTPEERQPRRVIGIMMGGHIKAACRSGDRTLHGDGYVNLEALHRCAHGLSKAWRGDARLAGQGLHDEEAIAVGGT